MCSMRIHKLYGEDGLRFFGATTSKSLYLFILSGEGLGVVAFRLRDLMSKRWVRTPMQEENKSRAPSPLLCS